MSFLLRRLDIAAEEPPTGSASPAVLDLLRGGDKAGSIGADLDEAACSRKDSRQAVESIRLRRVPAGVGGRSAGRRQTPHRPACPGPSLPGRGAGSLAG
jgi:hypothetical protein